MTQQKKVSGLDKFFGVTAAGSSMKVEIMAGLTTFFAMAYIIFVNPTILNQFYVITGQTEMATAIASSVFVATCSERLCGHAAHGGVCQAALRPGLRHGSERFLRLHGDAGQRLLL